ncbi:MAG TPA: hypothetical protein VL225_08540 [Vicinamibacterales bacterium]|nr:hypothetical protein [Vicinamibacterales bacterium]
MRIPPRQSRRLWRLVVPIAIAALPMSLGAQNSIQRSPDDILKQEAYQTPPKELADAVLAPRYLNVALANPSPDRKWFLDEIGDGPVVMKTFSKPFHDLGGLFVDYKANRARPLTVRNNIGIQLISAADGAKKTIQLPPGVRVSNATWSPDGTSIAFYVHGEDATHIWMADVATGQSRPITKTPVLATLVTSFEFTKDGKQIALVQIPDGRAAMPEPPQVPPGPSVKLALDTDKNRLRTFPSLMSTPYEEQLLEWHTTGQLALLDVAKGAVREIGRPAMISAISVSPDGKYVRVTRMVKPFSYDVPVSSFGSIEEIWDDNGNALAKVGERPINLGVQDDTQPPPDPNAPPAGGGGGRGGNQTGKREVAWRADGQGLTYVEQEPGSANGLGNGRAGRGDQASGQGGGRAQPPPARRDRVYQWLPPFGAAGQKVIYENATRIAGHRYSPDMKFLFFSERAGANTVESAVCLNEAPVTKYTLARYRTDDVTANPGTLLSTRGTIVGGRGAGGGPPAFGGRGGGGGAGPVQLSADGTSVFFEGVLYDRNPEQVGPKSFIDKVAIRTGGKERIYESENANVFERVAAVLDIEARRFVVQRTSQTEVPQNYLIDGGRRVQLTKNQDTHPDLTRAHIERFTVERADGFKFRVRVMLPENYQKGTRLPGIFWFYPREYTTQDEYDRPDRTYNRNGFISYGTRSMEYFTRLATR